MSNKTPIWEKTAIIVSAFAAFVAALVAAYQGCQMRETIQISYSTTRPFIVIEPVSQSSDLKKIVLQAKNTGTIPARVLYESGKTWIDKDPFRTSVDSKSQHVLYPNETVVLCEITPDDPDAILIGEKWLKIGFSLLYESVSPEDSRRWVAESWLYLNPQNKKLQIWKRDEKTVKQSTELCNIDSLIPSNWFESLEPPWQSNIGG